MNIKDEIENFRNKILDYLINLDIPSLWLSRISETNIDSKPYFVVRFDNGYNIIASLYPSKVLYLVTHSSYGKLCTGKLEDVECVALHPEYGEDNRIRQLLTLISDTYYKKKKNDRCIKSIDIMKGFMDKTNLV